jgi:hypothetical protein
MWGPAWIKIHWNSIWLRARSHMTSHYTWGSVTTLHDCGSLGTALQHFLLGSHNFMVTAIGLCVKVPTPNVDVIYLSPPYNTALYYIIVTRACNSWQGLRRTHQVAHRCLKNRTISSYHGGMHPLTVSVLLWTSPPTPQAIRVGVWPWG